MILRKRKEKMNAETERKLQMQRGKAWVLKWMKGHYATVKEERMHPCGV